jgi:hypothetical protein
MILIGSGIEHKRVEIPQLTRYNVCNPSIVSTLQGFECTVRGVNYDLEKTDLAYEFFYGSYSVPFPDTQNYYAVLNNNLEIQNYWFLEDRHLRNNIFSLDGIEDLRLFYWKSERYVIGGAINYPSQCSNITLMKLDGNVLERIGMFGSPTKTTTEKNWMPFVQGKGLSFLYTPNGQVLTYGESLEFTHTDRPNDLPNWSGSSCVMEKGGKYYAIIHKREKSMYTHKLVEYAFEGKLLWQSKEFNFEQFGIEFCAGMAFKGDDVVLSYGVMDKKALLLKMNFDEFRKVVS